MRNHTFFDRAGALRRPPARYLLAEARAIMGSRPTLESVPALAMAPRGDGHPVFVLPGFLTTDGRTARLRAFLAGRGYATYGWQLGLNLGPTDAVLRGVDRRFAEIRERHGTKVTLIGHSLGGIIARDLAKKNPEDTRQLIVMASPIQLPTASSLELVYNFLSRFYSAETRRSRDDLNRPPEVPVTALYTRTDGIVAWQSCLELAGPRRENIELSGDHSTMPSNPRAMLIIAERLAQPIDAWRPLAGAQAAR